MLRIATSLSEGGFSANDRAKAPSQRELAR